MRAEWRPREARECEPALPREALASHTLSLWAGEGNGGHGRLARRLATLWHVRHWGAALSDRVTSRVQHFRWDRGLAMRRTAFRPRVARDRLRCVSQVNQDIWSRTCRMHNIYTYETIWPRTYGLEHGLVRVNVVFDGCELWAYFTCKFFKIFA